MIKGLKVSHNYIPKLAQKRWWVKTNMIWKRGKQPCLLPISACLCRADLDTPRAALLVLAFPHRCRSTSFLAPAASCSIPVSFGRNLLNTPSYGLVKWKNYSWYDTAKHKWKAASWGCTLSCQECSELAQGKKRGLIFFFFWLMLE